jgi:hypothetical protein
MRSGRIAAQRRTVSSSFSVVWCGKPVDEVEVDAGDAGAAQRLDGARDHVGRLDPVDRGLHPGVEFLDAEARPGEALASDFLDHSVG